MPSGSTLACELRTGTAGLEGLRPELAALLARLPAATFHHSLAYHEALLQGLGPAADGVVFACLRDEAGTLRAVCPLQVGRRRICRLPFLAWQPPADADRPVDDFLLDPALSPAGVATALSRALRRARPEVQLLALDRVETSNGAWRVLAAGKARARMLRFGAVARIDTRCSLEQRLSGPGSKKFRSNLKRGWRDLAHTADYRIAREPPAVAAALEVFLALEASGWKGSSPQGNALERAPGARERFRCMVLHAAGRGAGEVHSLWLGDRCIASLVGLLGGQELFAVKIAYDEALAGASPGHLLFARVLETCSARPELAAVNVGWEAPWARPWRPVAGELWSAYLGLGGPAGRLALALLGLRGARSDPLSHLGRRGALTPVLVDRNDGEIPRAGGQAVDEVAHQPRVGEPD
jgi:CelD/BcsL family acetyltransferase involved in cellulose biosynthesis